MSTFPDVTLSGPRVTLRRFGPADVETVLGAGQDRQTQRWLPLPDPFGEEQAKAWCTSVSEDIRTSGRGLVRAIEYNGRAAGHVDLKRTDWRAGVTELAYLVAPLARGQGLAAEATRLLAEWVLREQGLERVELRIAPQNDASLSVATKAGFRREGVARNAGFVHGGRVDLVVWSLIPKDL